MGIQKLHTQVLLYNLRKSTAFAPGIVLIILLIKKYGLRKLIDGILVGLGTGLAAILPYVFSGVSPAILMDSTVIRVFQFGTLAFQYPQARRSRPMVITFGRYLLTFQVPMDVIECGSLISPKFYQEYPTCY